jgi:hypothetical protein
MSCVPTVSLASPSPCFCDAVCVCEMDGSLAVSTKWQAPIGLSVCVCASNQTLIIAVFDECIHRCEEAVCG